MRRHQRALHRPAVFDAYTAGIVVARSVLEDALEAGHGQLAIHQPELEEAVLDLIDERERSPALERVAA